MTIRSEVSGEMKELLEMLTQDQQRMMLDEADNLANALKYKAPDVRISTNGALEILFKVGCVMNAKGEQR